MADALCRLCFFVTYDDRSIILHVRSLDFQGWAGPAGHEGVF